MMLEMIWKLSPEPIDDGKVARPLLEYLLETPGFKGVSYDLNYKDQWRSLDFQHLWVDLITQRTQLIRIKGDKPDTLAMIATGKHGEQPTAVIQWKWATRDLSQISELWTQVFSAVPVDSIQITSREWRKMLLSRSIVSPNSGDILGMVNAWRDKPRGQGEGRGELPMVVVDNHWQLWLVDQDGQPLPEYKDVIKTWQGQQ